MGRVWLAQVWRVMFEKYFVVVVHAMIASGVYLVSALLTQCCHTQVLYRTPSVQK